MFFQDFLTLAPCSHTAEYTCKARCATSSGNPMFGTACQPNGHVSSAHQLHLTLLRATRAFGRDLHGQNCTKASALRRLIREPGEWPHGWQYWASSLLDTSFRKNSMLTGRPASRQAHLRTHSGLNAGIVFAHAPTTAECTVPPHLFRVLLLERLNLPLPITEATCNGCHEPLDPRGRH